MSPGANSYAGISWHTWGDDVTFMRVLIAVHAALATALAGADWPQFLGPHRNGTYPEPVSADALRSPRNLWKKAVGAGFSGPVAAGGKLILFHRIDNKEVVECLNAATGERVWSFDYPTTYRDDFGFDEGPRGTPAIADGRVHTFGAEGVLHALDLATGRKLWRVDTHSKFSVRKGFFGAAASPLVDGGKVYVNVGGPKGAGLVAFDAKDGSVQWTATDDDAGYSSPIAATIDGVRSTLCFTRAGLVALDPANGKVRFQFPWRSRSNASVNAAVPVVVGNLVFISASYATGAALLKVAGSQVSKVWSSDEALSNHYASSVYKDGYLFGFHGRQEHGQSLRCIELKSGKVAWSVDGFGAGTVTLAGDKLLVLRENGEAVIAPASAKAFQPEAKAQLLPATVRSYPAIADGRLYLRNEKQLAAFALNVNAANNPKDVFNRAVKDFHDAKIAESVAGFDMVAKLVPDYAPQLWQRGIALYYAGRYKDCREQFELHRTVNPNDVENAAWHFLCVAGSESIQKARAALLPVGPDPRVPMRDIYRMFRGEITPEQMISSAGTDTNARFYAHLYAGLYMESAGTKDRALEHIRIAADDRYSAGGYMHGVARVHLRAANRPKR
jgi:outer membrane protein assembly factor BamB